MAYPRNVQPMETWFVGIMLNKNTIVPCRTTLPRVDGSNTFTKHPPCAGQVTWGVVNGNSGGKNTDLGCVGKNRAIWQRNIVELDACINLYQLFMVLIFLVTEYWILEGALIVSRCCLDDEDVATNCNLRLGLGCQDLRSQMLNFNAAYPRQGIILYMWSKNEYSENPSWARHGSDSAGIEMFIPLTCVDPYLELPPSPFPPLGWPSLAVECQIEVSKCFIIDF